MKNYVPFPSSLKSIAYFSFFGVKNLKAVEGLFMFFPTKIWFIIFSIWWKEEHQQLITYYKLIEFILLDFLLHVRKNSHFWSCSISHSFVGICDIYLENSLLRSAWRSQQTFLFLFCLLRSADLRRKTFLFLLCFLLFLFFLIFLYSRFSPMISPLFLNRSRSNMAGL